MTFDTLIIVDWSGGNATGPKPRKDAIWACIGRAGRTDSPIYFRHRSHAEEWIVRTLEAERDAGRRAALGIDICFAYPDGLARELVGTEDPLALWDWFAARVEDTPTANNRFDLAGQINARFPGIGPFWGNGLKRDIAHLPRKGNDRTFRGLSEKRPADNQAKGAFSPWQLTGAGAVGGQVIMAFPMLSRLRHRFGTELGVWPFEDATRQITLIEVYLTLLKEALAAHPHPIRDAAQVELFARVLSGLPQDDWARLLNVPSTPQGWVLGLGHEELLEKAARQAPPLANDCFALPPGAHWTPVDEALARLKTNLRPVAKVTSRPAAESIGMRLAQEVAARRAHPPAPNSAVDGYGFSGALPDGEHSFPLSSDVAAAGHDLTAPVPRGQAVRILTGAILPEGVDTVVLQEDVTVLDGEIRCRGPLKAGANTRAAGEDMTAGQILLTAGHRLGATDLAMLAAAGVADVSVHEPLRVGVLSTGSELAQPGEVAAARQVFDANRPMLRGLVSGWDHKVVDLGCIPDDRETLLRTFDQARRSCDAIITSGGASAGDADLVSALLRERGTVSNWRIALKPGRPLMLGIWDGLPVFGLPGNPVAALVCALIFARPALEVLAGGTWSEPLAFTVPAAFHRRKKAGRREFLRARMKDGAVEVFGSEGSGRVSGLSWADGLVELPDDATEVLPGDSVRYLPFAGFGIS